MATWAGLEATVKVVPAGVLGTEAAGESERQACASPRPRTREPAGFGGIPRFDISCGAPAPDG